MQLLLSREMKLGKDMHAKGVEGGGQEERWNTP